MPRSKARQYPAYVPKPIREDYEEAHLILTDSPKASATLSRRALQGLMRAFYGATGKTLYAEIESVAEKVDPVLLRAIHAVRDVGNFGAHMQVDINYIVPVEVGEAEALLELLELMIDETYIASHERDQKVARVIELGAEKLALKAAAQAALPTAKPVKKA